GGGSENPEYPKDSGNPEDEPSGGSGSVFDWSKAPFNPFGPLIGDPLLTISVDPETVSKEYDGEKVPVTINTSGEFLNEGDYVKCHLIEQHNEVGSYVTRCRPRIYDKDGNDVTDNYAGLVRVVYKNYTITKRSIEIQTGSATQSASEGVLICEEYELINGTSLLEGHQLTVKFTGCIDKPGVTTNTVDLNSLLIVDNEGNNVTRNYKITWHYGLLTVT
ncbi:MAG: hypothetical protein K6B65_05635, partial [Bacilli bacterium]|nr:hypothetical protein [Bacilli bacterium]